MPIRWQTISFGELIGEPIGTSVGGPAEPFARCDALPQISRFAPDSQHATQSTSR
ncbi:hypothetical protein OG241_47540 [Streptomyces sp. NBC_01390]|uniref:hypothetical protein n=1 Tax=Streptomyces sp. NBC_01390 TaxID=2903850 RepID=UPI0032453654